MSAPKHNYPEVTPAALAVGVIVGVLLVICSTYSGLVMGFTIGGSALAAIIGFGVLRGLLGRGTIVENNINQTVASAINIGTAGVIFTIQAFYLMNSSFSVLLAALATAAGAALGVLFIIPLRKQMIELDRLRFPTGTAVAAVLRSPGAGVRKAIVLACGVVAGIVITGLTEAQLLPSTVDLGALVGTPPYVANIWAVSAFAIGAGYITGLPGLVVLAGGLLAYWLIAPLAVYWKWVDPALLSELRRASGPESYEIGAQLVNWIRSHINRPIGIGMLVGGAMVGVLLSLPSMIGAVRGLARAGLKETREELPLGILGLGIGLAFVLLAVTTRSALPEVGIGTVLLIAFLATAWIALAGLVVAQATGMTDWSPISGLALLSVVVFLLLGKEVGAAILIGAAVCVAIGECADMMQDLKTGHLVGAMPIRQQTVELAFVAIGPVVCLAVLHVLASGPGIGPESKLNLIAPQAQAVVATVDAVEAGAVPWAKYGGGAAIGGLLSLSGFPGLGVLVGLSMYLPLPYILTYGLGCLLQVAAARVVGRRAAEDWGLPFAAGLLAGEPFVVLAHVLYKMATGAG